MPQFTVLRLEADRLGEAYPLVRSATRLSLDRWQAFARGLYERGGGVLAVLAEDGRIHGAATYRPADSLRHESGLLIEVIACFELSGSARVRKALCTALEATACGEGYGILIFDDDSRLEPSQFTASSKE